MSEPKLVRKGQELEKFKRRMIRSIARKMKEKKPDNEMWEDMKKEIGSNCKKLWERMKMLTLKKLKRLLEAEDRVDLISPVARMTLTDWLLFDLVIVHEKIDVIGREKLNDSYRSKVLMNLFALVQRFEIESRSGENLAEAWTAATVYYNSKGHQCSPMLLQRRWYQVKELTRHKFYKFWFNYRGNQKQLVSAKQDSPDDLQKAIAHKYPGVITAKFQNWEERIEQRLVILPDELGVKMRQKNLMKPSDTTAPDIVLIEPQIEVIDLGANSESDETLNEAIEINAPLIKIKSEPVDQGIDVEYSIPPEKGSEFDAEIERLQMVEETFDDNAFISEPITDPETPGDMTKVDNAEEMKDNPINLNDPNVVAFSVVDGQVTNIKRKYDAILIDDSPQKEAKSNYVTETSANDVIVENNNSHTDESNESDAAKALNSLIKTIDCPNESIAQISAVASIGIKVENVNDVIENVTTKNVDKVHNNLDETDTVPETLLDNLDGTDTFPEFFLDNLDETNAVSKTFPVISTVSSAGIKVEKDLIVQENTGNPDNYVAMSSDIAINDNSEHFGISHKLSETLPVKNQLPSKDVKIEMDIEPIGLISSQVRDPGEVEPTSTEDGGPITNLEVNEPTDTLMEDLCKKKDLAAFGELPADMNFEDSIEFADDGIAYIEDDEDDIISFRDPPPVKTEFEEDEDDLETDENDTANGTEVQKFDLKLLMCPVVYTTKLDAMTVFDGVNKYDQVYDKLLIDKIYTLSKPVSKHAITMPEVDETNDTVNVDDLFINEHLDCESEDDEIERIKLTSYMLQKPKHRTYNPVLLCKNPDFNTRLKKLSVGFFMSARNRALLQSCIPMTIDITKAFEDKLVNGTLYLKPTPIDQVIGLNNDVEINSAALVKPSTVQQSCMNIDDTLETELKKRMAERVRAINLPDISQVRRLNQHLLTAEVTPLRPDESSNKQTPEISEKTGPEIYVHNIKNDIDNLLSQQKTNDSPDLDNLVAEASTSSVNDIKLNVDLGTIVQPSPLLHSSSAIFTHQTINPNRPMVNIPSHTETSTVTIPTETPSPRSQPISPPHDTAKKQTTNEEPNNSANSTVKPKKVNRRPVYPNVAWNRRPVANEYKNNEPYDGDALLTIDTLYKMLTALDPMAIPDIRPIKKNDKKKREKKIKMVQKNIEKSIDGFIEKTTEQDTVDVTIDITGDDVEQEAQKLPKCKAKIVRPAGRRYCCWSNFKIDKLKRMLTSRRKHKCDPHNCICCCKEELLLYTDEVSMPFESENPFSETIEHVINETNVSNVGVDASIQINLDEIKSCKELGSCVTIESSSSVQMEIESYEEPRPCVTIEKSSIVPMEIESNEEPRLCVTTESSSEPIETDNLPLENAQNIPLDSTTVQISEDEEVNVTTDHPDTPIVSPSPKVRCFAGNRYKQRSITRKRKYSFSEKSIIFKSKDYMKKKSLRLPKYLQIDNAPIILNYRDRRKVSRVEPKLIEVAPCLACVRRISPVAYQGAIEINGGHTCKQHFKTKKKIESKVVLSKKLITDENQPFFVGKGKILLTNMRKPVKDIPVVEQNTPDEAEVEAIRLPAGVQIVLLPDQTLTYLIETNVTLTPEESAILPEFLVAIQQQINEGGITLPASNPPPVDEVIDLDNDEFTTTTNAENTIGSTIDESTSAENTAPDKRKENTNIDCEVEVDHIANEHMQIEDTGVKTSNITAESRGDEKVVSRMAKNCEISSVKDIFKTAAEFKENETCNANEGDVADNTSKEQVISVSADDPNNKKSLLSDLMEMSGIMEEDLAPPPLVVTVPQEPIIIDTRHFVLRRPRVRNVVTVPTIPVSSSVNSYIAVNNDGSFELSAVLSFTELKYACDNNGLFFKLDLETGQLSNINVSIQKFPSKPVNPSTDKSDLIDLTDDPDICITGTTGESQFIEDNTIPTTAPSVTQHDMPSSKTQISTILQKKQRLMERLSNNLKPVNILQSKKHVARILKSNRSLIKDRQFMFYSKRKLNKIEAKINLVESDAPMEEEYLESDNSSDDEPLINKVKRMRPDDASLHDGANQSLAQAQASERVETPSNTQEPLTEKEQLVLTDGERIAQNTSNQPDAKVAKTNDITEPSNELQHDENLNADMDEDIFDESGEEVANLSEPTFCEPVPTSLLLSGGAFNAHNIPLNQTYRADGEDSQDEDCILGV